MILHHPRATSPLEQVLESLRCCSSRSVEECYYHQQHQQVQVQDDEHEYEEDEFQFEDSNPCRPEFDQFCEQLINNVVIIDDGDVSNTNNTNTSTRNDDCIARSPRIPIDLSGISAAELEAEWQHETSVLAAEQRDRAMFWRIHNRRRRCSSNKKVIPATVATAATPKQDDSMMMMMMNPQCQSRRDSLTGIVHLNFKANAAALRQQQQQHQQGAAATDDTVTTAATTMAIQQPPPPQFWNGQLLQQVPVIPLYLPNVCLSNLDLNHPHPNDYDCDDHHQEDVEEGIFDLEL